MSQDGFLNEDEMLEELNNKKFKNINKNMQNFIEFACGERLKPNDLIECKKESGWNKSDLIIYVNDNRSFRVSIKKGKSNSVHQEPVEDFISYISKEFNADDDVKNAIRFFIWGDGTFDGSGSKRDRMGVLRIKASHPEIIRKIKSFFLKYKRGIIKRFLIEGLKSTCKPDFIYYGSKHRGLWAKIDDAINYLSKDENESNSAAPIGGLTFQAWNRGLNKNKKLEKRRGHVQAKWTNIKKDLKKLMS